jgi:hypothetical protein
MDAVDWTDTVDAVDFVVNDSLEEKSDCDRSSWSNFSLVVSVSALSFSMSSRQNWNGGCGGL